MNPKIILRFLAVFLFFISLGSELYSQRINGEISFIDTTQLHHVYTEDGTKLIGRIVAIEGDKVSFALSSDTINFPFSKVERVDVLNKERGKAGRPEYLKGYQKLFVGPTGMNLKKGDYHYETIWGGYHFVDFGVHDYVSVGAGYLLPFVVVVKAKFGGEIKENFHLSAGVQGLAWPTLFSGEVLGGLYSHLSATYGNTEKQFTVTGGYVAGSNGFSMPVVNFGGFIRMNDHVAILSEAFLFFDSINNEIDQTVIAPSIGARFNKRNFRLDGGMFFLGNAADGLSVLPLPFLSVAVHFGPKNPFK